jgi:acyl-CoA thioester hydrolase
MSAASDDRAAHGFERSIRAQWSDMDQNGHMQTTAYLAAAEDVRMQFFDAALRCSDQQLTPRSFGYARSLRLV